MRILAATGNRHKLDEFRSLLAPHGFVVLGAADVGGLPPVVEDADSFEGNAAKKAVEIALATGLPCFSDDSGLEVAALNGSPGVYSARYAGPKATDDDNVQLLLRRLHGIKDRRARFTSDFGANGETISRHFSVGSFLLPGKWESMFVVPAAQHLVDGGKPYERQLPKWDGKDIMLGHWHRPPLSLVFKRKSGVRLEVGTGSDVFRWEQNMGYHPEHGSYKVTLTQAGLEVLREPLACCEDFVPEGRPFRYTWHLAWDKAGVRSTPPEHEVVKAQVARNGHDLEWEKVKKAFAAPRTDDKPRFLLVDIMDFLWEDTCKRCPSPQAFAAELVAPEPCWMTSPVEKKLKNLIRKLVEIPGVGGLIFRNVSPGICYHPSHVDKKNPMGVAHWDMGGMMDFAAWARQACRDKFEVYSEAAEGWDTPAMNTLFD